MTIGFLDLGEAYTTKLESAKLLLKFNEIYREELNKIFRCINYDDGLGTVSIDNALRYYEYLTLFVNDDIIDFEHFYQMHGRNLQLMFKNRLFIERYNEARKKDPKYNYVQIKKVLEKMKKRGMPECKQD